ncbi:glycosyltransferase [Caulobacter segnis]
MRIALFFWSLELGGVEHMLVNLSRELVERGHEVTLVLARSPQPNSFTPDPRVRVVWLHTPSITKLVPRLAEHLKSERYDAAFTGMPTSNLALLLARRIAGVKTAIVISERSNPQLEAASSRTWRYRAAFMLQPFIYPWADAIIAVSTDLADALSKFARLPRRRIEVVYNPAYDERSPVTTLSEAPHPWLRDRATPTVVGAGRFRDQKDFSTMLKVIAAVAAERPVRAIILGDGEQRDALKAEAAMLKLNGIVDFPGFVENVGDWLAFSDVFMLTSKWEGFGNILVQALAAGCDIVSTDCPDGPREILDGGRFGHLAPVGDVSALVVALNAALDAPPARETQHSRALDFTVTRSADRYESLFRELSQGSAS